MIWSRRKHKNMKMKICTSLVGLLVLLFCMSVRCAIYDDEATVRKARCYANCITMVSYIPINDSSCLSSQCLECKIPCDRDFDSVENCTQKCPKASIYCNQSCTFLGVTKTWTNIYQGNGNTIGKPGVVQSTTRNVTTLTLSWQPPVNASGTVVYLLKEKRTGDLPLATPTPLKGLVFLGPRAILTAQDACSVKPGSLFGRHKFDGISFSFTVVALTEVSIVVEGQQSSLIDFQKADAIASLHNASLFYNPSKFRNDLEFRVWFTPSPSSSIVTNYLGISKKTGGQCKQIEIDDFKASKDPNKNRLLVYFGEKTKTCNISFTAYSLTECLPSKPISIEYYYKGCHYLPSMNTSICCEFDPLPTPDSAKAVRNLTYSLQTQSDFRFTANITWLPPTQPCPVATRYILTYKAFLPLINGLWDFRENMVNTHYIMSNIKPNLERKITVNPYFGSSFHDLGIDKVITIKTPGFPPNETIITNLQHHLQWPTSPADRFTLNISWVKPKFNYSRIEGYNITYTVLGDVAKRGTTQQLWYVVRGLDFAQKVSYQVLPVYRHPWILTKATEGQASVPVLPLDDTMARNLQHHLQQPTSPSDRFTLNISWVEPKFIYSRIEGYNITYTVLGDVAKSGTTQQLWYVVRGLDYTQKVSYQVLSSFYHPWIQTKATVGTATLPGLPLNETMARNLQHHLQRPTSPSDRFTLNISWVKPKFSYTRIKGYNITYSTVLGDVPKHNTTQQLWYVVRGLDYTQIVSFQVLPVYRDPWVLTKAGEGQASVPVLKDEDIKIQGFNQSFIKTNNLYRLLVRWSRPKFQRNISCYKVSYELTGNAGDELDCPSKSSTKRKCRPGTTTNTSYAINNIHEKERIEITVTPVFENTHAFQGKPWTLVAIAPGTLGSTTPKPWGSGQVALLVVGILVFLAILLLLLLLFLRWKKQKDVENGKVDRHRGLIIDHWEISHNNLDLLEVIGEGAFGKVYKGTLLEFPDKSTNTGSSSMSFGRRSTIRSTRSSRGDDPYLVAVKMLHDNADDDQRKEFLKEMQLMKDVGSHRNIVNMLGCGTIRDPMFLIVEYLPNGDLLHYLRKRRGNNRQYPESDSRGPNHSTYCQSYFKMNGKPRAEASLEFFNKGFYVNTNAGFQDESEDGGIQLVSVNKISGKDSSTPPSNHISSEDDELDDEIVTSGDLMAFAWQVAQGMEYLSKRGYVHRDLAARNVLIGNNKEAKVADFGLTRHMYEDLYRAKTNRRLPLKWMSIEAIFDQIFTSQSDVWAFGVLLWEIVTLGGTPYPAKTNKELLNFLKEGNRMEKPDTCDDEVYRIMMSCWKEKAVERPTFVQIREKFEEMMMRENPYFDPSSVDESRDYYNVPSFNSIEDSNESDDEVFNEILGIGKTSEMENESNGNAVSDKEERLSQQEKHEDEFNEKALDMGDIETLLYRKQHHSIKQKPDA